MKYVSLVICSVISSVIVIKMMSSEPITTVQTNKNNVEKKLLKLISNQNKRISELEKKAFAVSVVKPHSKNSAVADDFEEKVRSVVGEVLDSQTGWEEKFEAQIAEQAQDINESVLSQMKANLGKDVVKNWHKYEQEISQERVKNTIVKKLELSGSSENEMNSIFDEYFVARKNIQVDVKEDASWREKRKARETILNALRDERNEKVKTLLGSDEEYKKYKTVISSINRGNRSRDKGGR